MKIIDLKTSGYFSGSIMFLGILLLGSGIFLFVKSWILGMILVFISVIIFTTHNRLRIDFERKVFLDYLWILGMKHGVNASFETIQYIFIKKVLVSQRMNTRVSTSTIRKEVYKGFLKFSEEEKVFLAENDRKDKLIEKLRSISKKIQVDVVDFAVDGPRIP